MSKILSFVLSITLVIIAAPAPSIHAQTPQLISSIFNKMERNRQSLRSLRAMVVLEKHNAQLGDNEYQFGTMAYVPGAGRNANVRVDWQRPQQETLAVQNGEYKLCRPRLNQCWVGNANSSNGKVSNVLGFGLNASGASIRANFNSEALGVRNIDGAEVVHIKLTPRGRVGYKFAEIWVDNNGMPVATKVVERNGDWTTVKLGSIQRNAQVNSNEFRLDTGNAKIVRS